MNPELLGMVAIETIVTREKQKGHDINCVS